MKKFLYLLLSWVVAFSLLSCGKEVKQEEAFDENYAAELKLGRDSYDAAASASSFQLRITSDYLWKVILPEGCDWIAVEPMSGMAGDVRVKFSIAANDSGEERAANVLVQSGKTKKRLNITQARKAKVMAASDVEDLDRIYIPLELRGNDFFTSSSKWFFGRSRQSEHFIVFWEKGSQWDEYGDKTPADANDPRYMVDIDDLLEKAESFFESNIDVLKFSVLGKGESTLDRYKMMIMLNHSADWLATGAGYDNIIGALWVNPSSCQPVGSTIAHEIGHSFQYMVSCDYLEREGVPEDERPYFDVRYCPGWRYGYGPEGEGGNAFWEQTAQWQSYHLYRDEAFRNYYADGFFGSTHLHVMHEGPRYSNYFIHWWWVEQNDIEFIGKLWRLSRYPEDPCETYMRLMGYDNAGFNDSIWEYAAHMVTFDCNEIRDEGRDYIGRVATTDIAADGDYWRIGKRQAPESTGFNAIRMILPSDGKVTVNFRGVLDMDGVKCGSEADAGWRYGFVSYNSDGSTTYSDIASATGEDTVFEINPDAQRLWFVVTGAPKEYERHPWVDDSEDNDIHWPWKARFSGTAPYGK